MSAFVTGKCRLRFKSAEGTYQDGVVMAYFRTCALKKRGQVFTRVGLLVDLYSVTRSITLITLTKIWIILDIMRNPNPIIVLLYIQNSHTKIQAKRVISPLLWTDGNFACKYYYHMHVKITAF